MQTLIGVVRMQETTRRPRKSSRLKRPEKLRQKQQVLPLRKIYSPVLPFHLPQCQLPRLEHVVPCTHCELEEALACIRKIKRNLHNQKNSAQRMIHEIEEIDDMSGTPLACTRLHELRNKNNSLRGSYGTSQPKVGVATLTYLRANHPRRSLI